MENQRALFEVRKKSSHKNAYIQFADAGWVPILLAICMFSAIFVPYIIVLLRGTMNPLLPFISQAAGSPPQSGIFAISLSLSATVGLFGLHLLYLGISIYEQRVTEEKKRVLQFLNKVSLAPGYIALLGMIVAGSYPVDFHRHSENWIMVTIAPHLTGACLLFGGGVTYCSLLTLIMTITFPEKKKLLAIRICLLSITIITALMHAFTVFEAFDLEYSDAERLKSCEVKPLAYDRNYILCSICEWVMAISFVSFFLTIYDEGKLMSVTLSVDILENADENEDSIKKFKSPPSKESSKSTECLIQKESNTSSEKVDKLESSSKTDS